ncbi:Transcription factor TFIIIB component B'' [Orchesella cincta]|uniref:Transcription factor TFIIIB component B n=1 Tax=Orchesella cincta TaxID=48709 RepID=A0A1D2MHK0_ORCCI|nr:Transcription factor TFIIIB component B'' [Orchesella cincta]
MVYPHSPDKSHRHSSGRDSATSRGSENSCPYPGGMGAFSSISNKDNICPSPSFSKTVLDNPDNLKRRLEERRKEAPNPTKFAQARRDFYEKVNNGQTPERSKLTMLHFTFYNPPKPGGSDSGRKGKSRSSRASSVCSEMENSNKEIIVDDKKAASAPSSIASRRTTASSIGSGIGSGGSVVSVHDDCQSEAGSTASNNSSNVPGPRVKVGPDGQLIIDEQSLVVETSESQRARKQIEDMEVVSGADYAVGSSGFYRYKRSYRRGHDWTEKETIRFYRALNQCGTDFSMMLSLFPNRSRQELKSKFKREDRKNPDMVSKALASCHFDPDEGISSDEDLALYYGKTKNVEDGGLTEKEKLLREEMEVEQVICSSEDPLQGKAKKKKKEKVEFTAAQKKEFNLTNFKGAGTGKGKKWNSPVVGLTGKLPPMSNPSSVPIPSTAGLTRFVSVKVEPAVKLPPKKRAPKKSKTAEKVNDGEATVPIIVAPGAIIAGSVVSDNTLPFVTVKKEGKRRRLPKTKPNVKLESVKRNRTSNDAEIVEAEAAKSSSQTTKSSLVCDDLFRYDAYDPLGLNVTLVPLPVVETVLEGNEEGREGLVMVDLDELNAVVREQASSSDTSSKQTEAKNQGQSSKRRRKSSSNTDGIAVTTARVVHGDPFGKSNMTTTVAAIKKEKDVGSGLAAANKKVKVLPYRVPGPGGNLADCRRSSLADELEIEIELNTPSTES